MKKDSFEVDLSTISPIMLHNLSNEKFRYIVQSMITLQKEDRKENQLLYYKPVSDDARAVHESTATWIGCSGGNGSSKTTTVLVHFMALATGVFPLGMEDVFR